MASRLRSVPLFGLSLAVVVPLVLPLAAQPQVTKQDADRCQGKFGRITGFANAPKARASASGSAASQTTQLTDAELNSYLHFHLKEQVPTGVVDPTLNALGDGRVRGGATIDLDAVRKQRQRGWTDPMSYMTGKLPLTASGLLITQEMASAGSSSRPPRFPASRFRRAWFRSSSRSTRSRLRTLQASAWTTPSSCPPVSRRSAWGRGKRWWCNRSPAVVAAIPQRRRSPPRRRSRTGGSAHD